MRWVLFALSLPWTIVLGYPWVLFFAIFAAKDLRFDRYGVLTAVWRDWVVRPRGKDGRPIWRYSTTLGRGIIYQPSARRSRLEDPLTETEDHELVHVRQVEDLLATSFVVGVLVAAVTGNWILGLALWASGGAWQLPHFLTSAARHGGGLEGLYRQNEHERSARAQTSRWCGGKSWISVEEASLKGKEQ